MKKMTYVEAMAAISIIAVLFGSIGLVISYTAEAREITDTDTQKKFLYTNGLDARERGFVSYSAQPYQWQITTAGTQTNTYTRYKSGTGVQFIKRLISTNGLFTTEYSMTNWSARATATYSAING